MNTLVLNKARNRGIVMLICYLFRSLYHDSILLLCYSQKDLLQEFYWWGKNVFHTCSLRTNVAKDCPFSLLGHDDLNKFILIWHTLLTGFYLPFIYIYTVNYKHYWCCQKSVFAYWNRIFQISVHQKKKFWRASLSRMP